MRWTSGIMLVGLSVLVIGSAFAAPPVAPAPPGRLTLSRAVAATVKGGTTTVTAADREAARTRFGGRKSRGYAAIMANAAGLTPAARIAYRQMAMREAAGPVSTRPIENLRPYYIESAELRGASVTYGNPCLTSASVDIAFTVKNRGTVAPTEAPRLAIEKGDESVQFKVLPILQPGASTVVEMTNVPLARLEPIAENCYTVSAWPMFVGQVLDATPTQLTISLPRSGAPVVSLTRHPGARPDGKAPGAPGCKLGEKHDTCYYDAGPFWGVWPETICVPNGTLPGTLCP